MLAVRRILLPALLLLPTASALAVCAHTAAGNDYCGPELVSLLYIDSSGAVYVKPSTPLAPTPAGFACRPVAGSYFVLNQSNANFKQIYAALLSARIAGAPLMVVSDPSQSSCTILYVTL